MDILPILSTCITILIILILILIAAITFYYARKDHQRQTIDPNAIEEHFATLLSNTNMQTLMLANIEEDPDKDIISGEAGFLDIMRSHKIINGKKLDQENARQTMLEYKLNPANELEKEHFQYLIDLKLANTRNHEHFRNRTVTARFLEDTFTQHQKSFFNKTFRKSHDKPPQKNLIHELITHANQGGYICFMHKIINRVFSNYIISSAPLHLSINTINSHTIAVKFEAKMASINKTEGLEVNTIDNITYSISFTMSSKPGDIFGSISYNDIKFRLDMPKSITQSTTNLKTVKRTQENAHRVILNYKKKNSLVYQLPDFVSHGLLHATHKDGNNPITQKILHEDLNRTNDTVQHQR